MTYKLAARTPMILMLQVHDSRARDLETPNLLATDPIVPIESFRDCFGNSCCRVMAPAGKFVVSTDSILRDSGQPDPKDVTARQLAVEKLPSDVLTFLLPSRYCETDILSAYAWKCFGNEEPGWSRVQAVCDFVHKHVSFGYAYSRATRTAVDTLNEAVGVCRDYTHLAIALCRCLNIPARYCTGYISDVGQPPPHPEMDFSAWMEVYLGGQWWVFDPRNNDVRVGRVLMGRGRDAADVAFALSFGQHELAEFRVWIDPIEAGDHR
ncbi:transglutaminase family protein [Paracoccus sp. MBLB3053]|uniref:Transglutaminase family protein n=1 Tax=Paracoccus aurantius TaxID=3073814 RepID=A0ABU2HX20_9RHOB|nr:transglutaminase family protein [Paracoccus sp. MBLB3053]MDS9469563.1 transglutaminase family protein [Paracoccus sp. MBLB3053]